MRVLLVHLSDVHLKADGTDSVIPRAVKIAQAVNSRNDAAIQNVLVLITGDVAYSGKRAQYDLASEFIKELASKIEGTVSIAVVPGNHDCDFTADSGLRDLIIQSIRQNPGRAVDASIIDQCVTVQNAFFEFRDSVAHDFLSAGATPLYYEYNIPIGNDAIVVRCYNTAWMSELHEKPGGIVFPIAALPPQSGSRFAIAIFHHPYNWLVPATSRPFRRMIENNSGLVLTGHEHEYDRNASLRPDSMKATAYVEAGALHESGDPAVSAFNVIILDTAEEKQRFHHFSWDGGMYRPVFSSAEWEPLPLNMQRASREFDVQLAFREWLDDAGIPNASKNGRKRLLGDIFLYPQLIEAVRDTTMKQRRTVVKSGDVFSTISSLPLVFVSAPPKGGRTALAKRLFVDSLAAGAVPLYVDALEGGLRAADGVPSIVFRQAERQYGAVSVELYRQLDRATRIVILDNIDRLNNRTDSVVALIRTLQKFAGRVVILGDDSAGKITELAMAANVGGESNAFEVQPFNHGLRERLAQQWFVSDRLDSAGTEVEQSRLLDRVAQTLDIIIGRNYVPAFPIYVVAVLQAYEEGESVDVRASTHGYFYEMLIRLALASGGGARTDFDIRLSFLTHLAAEMFAGEKERYLLWSELRASFDRYQEKHAIGGLSYEVLVEALISRGMLYREADRVRFQYPYLYYYFVANHFSRNIGRDVVRQQIESLAERLNTDESGDILLFLAHLTSDEFVINKMLNAARSHFPGTVEATLEGQGGRTESTLIPLTYVEARPETARQAWADSIDAQTEESKGRQTTNNGSDEAAGDIGQEFHAALQTLRIVGQILKNFPGSLDATTKIALTNACYGIGLRGVAVAFREIEAEKPPLIEQILEELREANAGLSTEKLRGVIDRYFWFVTLGASFGLIRAVATSVAAPELSPIYEETLGREPSIAVRLIDFALSLETSDAFPIGLLSRLADDVRGLPIPLNVLRVLVLQHFQRVAVDKPHLQAACAKLGIEYQPVRLRPLQGT
jgi:predicted MPP superfamily phosphohydrolase